MISDKTTCTILNFLCLLQTDVEDRCLCGEGFYCLHLGAAQSHTKIPLLQYLLYKVHVRTSTEALLSQLWLLSMLLWRWHYTIPEKWPCCLNTHCCICLLPLDRRRCEGQTAACLKNWTMKSEECSVLEWMHPKGCAELQIARISL